MPARNLYRRPRAADLKEPRRWLPSPNQPAEEHASGLLTPLMFAAREGDLESARAFVAAGADVNAIGGDGKDALGLAIFNGSYDLASFLIDNHAQGESGRRPGIYAAVLGRGSPQYGNAARTSPGW